MRRPFRTRFNLFLLALAVVLFSPLWLAQAATQSHIQVLGDDPCQIVRDCCAKMAACCCEVQPQKPAPAADLAGAPLISPTDKFIATKDSGKLVSQNLPVILQRPLLFRQAGYRPIVAPFYSRPLYILNCALLI